MNERKKPVHSNKDHQDRFVSLPTNLIISILMRMPLRDAARTSILSQHWRYLWANNPYLVFDKNEFYHNLFRNKLQQFIRAINSILLSHIGPIHKFFLFIPQLNLHHYKSYIDNWILVVSRNHIKQLSIQNSNCMEYNLPSYVLNCSKLTHLHLSRCALSPPLQIKGLKTLVCICLENMHFSAEIMRTLVLPSLHVLRHLEFKDCYGLEILRNFRIHVPNLRRLSVIRGHGFDLQFFETNQCGELVHVEYSNVIDDQERNGTVNLVKLFDNICKTEELKLSGYPLKFLAADGVPNCLPNLNNQLTKVCFCNFGFDRLEHVSFALCLLRSSPNLKILEINASIVWNAAMEAVEIIDILEKPGCLERGKETGLNKLMRVKLTCLNGSRIELLFIKLLLSHSSRLESLRVELKHSRDELRILTELLRFNRESPKAEIVATFI